MITNWNTPVLLSAEDAAPRAPRAEERALRENSMAVQILRRHDTARGGGHLALFADKLASTENVYVNVLQSACASGFREFPVPTVLFNDHNSLCSVGGTICEDDHMYGLSCAKRYGGIFVPQFCGVIHQFMREQIVASGDFILATDSHTRYGALGAVGIGEGGGQMVKQLLRQPYCMEPPKVTAVRLKGAPPHGVGPHDIALALIKAVYPDGLVKNRFLEFIGEGISALSMDKRFNIDAMCTETSAISTIWKTDEKTAAFFQAHGRGEDYARMEPRYPVLYDGLLEVDLGQARPMIALPFHPSNAYTIEEFNANTEDILASVEKQAGETMPGFSLRDRVWDRRFHMRQGAVAGCAGGLYENLCAVSSILGKQNSGSSGCRLHLYPASLPILARMEETGVTRALTQAGATVFQSYCGPCFGTQDIPCSNDMALRHITRNFPNREGSRPGEGQSACVALMDARSIAATFLNGGELTGADSLDYVESWQDYRFDGELYARRVYNGWGRPQSGAEIFRGPNIVDWPVFDPLPPHLLLQVSGVYPGILTTDALLPSGEASAYRSNPERLAEYTLVNADPAYRERSKAIRSFQPDARNPLAAAFHSALEKFSLEREHLGVRSVIVGDAVGDGSAREQAASNQRILGGGANLAVEYCTSRYRSNLISWGLLPLLRPPEEVYCLNDILLLPNVRNHVRHGEEVLQALLWRGGAWEARLLRLPALQETERKILLAGCMMNYYRESLKSGERES